MKKLLLLLFVTVIVLTGCKPKVDPVEADPVKVDSIILEVYWVSYCHYCTEQLAVLEEIAQELVGHPYLEGKVEIIGANMDLTPEELFAALQINPFSFVMTTGNRLPNWSSATPTIVIRDAFGNPIFQYIGFLSKAGLYSAIMEALGYTEVI